MVVNLQKEKENLSKIKFNASLFKLMCESTVTGALLQVISSWIKREVKILEQLRIFNLNC